MPNRPRRSMSRRGSSATAPTCRTGASTARRSRRWPGRAAARAPGRWPPTTRTPPRWASRRPAWRCARRRRHRRAVARVLDRRRRPTSTRPTPPPSTPRCGSPADVPALDVGGAVRSAVGALRARARPAAAPRSWSPPTSAPACPAAPTRPPAATAPPRCWSATTPTAPVLAELLGTALGHRGVPRPLAHARRRPLEAVGGAVRRDQLRRRSASRRGTTRSKAAGLDADRRRPRRRHRHARPRRRGRSRKRLGVEPAAIADDLAGTVGNTGAAHPALLLAVALEARRARPGASRWSCWPTAPTCSLFRATDAIAAQHAGPAGRRAGRRPARRSPYGKFLALAGHAHRRAAPPARAGPGVGVGRGPQRGLEVRLRRVAATASTGALHLPPHASRDGGASTTWSRCRWPTSTGTIVTFTVDRLAYSPSPPIVFAVVDFDGGGRLPVELTDVDAGEVADRRPGRDDVPPAVHRRRHPQLLLEGPAGAVGRIELSGGDHGIARDQGPGRDRRDGLHARSASTGTRAPTTCSSTRPTRRSPSAGVDKDDVDAYWLGTAQSGMSGITLARPLQLEDKPVTRVENYCATGSEALRQAAYAVASGAYDVAMAVGVEKVKDCGYQGLNAFPIPTDGTSRTLTAAAMFSMVAPGLRQEVRRRPRRAARGARPHRVEEPLQRRPQPAGAVPPGDERRDDLRDAARWPATSACSTAPAWPTARRRRSSCGPRTPTATPTSRST